MHGFNRLGAIPLVGTIIGAVRLPFAILASLFLSLKVGYEFLRDGEIKVNGAFSELTEASIHIVLALAELIPGLGSFIHAVLDDSSFNTLKLKSKKVTNA